MRVPSNRIGLLSPLVKFLKSLIISVLLVFCDQDPATQCLVGLSIEISYFLYSISNAALQTEWFEKMLTTSLQLLVIGLIACKYASLGAEDGVRQNLIGVVMVCILVGMLFISVLLTVVTIVCVVKELVNHYKQHSNQPETKHTEDNTVPPPSSIRQMVEKPQLSQRNLFEHEKKNEKRQENNKPDEEQAKPVLRKINIAQGRIAIKNRSSLIAMTRRTPQPSAKSLKQPSAKSPQKPAANLPKQ